MFRDFGTNIVSVQLPIGGRFTHAIVEAQTSALNITRAIDTDGILVCCEQERIPTKDNPELAGLYHGGLWDVTKLTQLLMPCEPSKLSIQVQDYS